MLGSADLDSCMAAVIEIEDLVKTFQVGFWKKRPVLALDHLCLDVEPGEIFGFLGPNGAGKTTTLKILMDLLRPTSGTTRILGEPSGSGVMKKRIGYLPENPYFYDYLTAGELLTYVGKLFEIRQPELGQRVRTLLEKVGLAGSRDQQLRKFSKGMIQRIGIAQALINNPEVVFLDEPMSGLDPIGRREVREVIRSLKERGTTVFFSSHILPDVEQICDRVAIMNRGRLRETGSLEKILNARMQGHEIILSRNDEKLQSSLKPLCDSLTSIGDRLQVHAADAEQLESILAHAFRNGAPLVSVTPLRLSLEDYFLQEVAADRNAAAGQEAQ
jgi:ABC-2 type transport system ATP-binding protein